MGIQLKRHSLATKLGIGQGVLVLSIMAISTCIITSITAQRSMQEAENNLAVQAKSMVDSMAAYHSALQSSSGKLANVFAASLPGKLRLDPSKTVRIGEKETGALWAGSTQLNLNTEIVDHFTEITGAVATVFARSGEDFIRISTSLKKEDGSRAIGTALDRTHPAYQGLLNGAPFTGKATLFGKEYMTRYLPMKDEIGKVIAVLFVGLDFTESLKEFKAKVKSVKVGETGYIYAFDARPGKDQGRLTIHPAQEGTILLDAVDASGHKFIQEMISKRDGIIRYPWINKALGETSPRDKVVAYRYFGDWGWIIGVGSYMDDVTRFAHLVRNITIGSALLVVLLLLTLPSFLIKLWVTTPARRVISQSELYAQGDFTTATVADEGDQDAIADEVELLSRGVSKMAVELRRILSRVMASTHEVRTAAGQVRETAEQISSGSQAVAAQSITVATAGEEMSSTSASIAENCHRASIGAQAATDTARNGAEIVDRTIDVMHQISDRVQKSAQTVATLGEHSNEIGTIIGTIKDIADQTNLLALNAAIEAARAGEQGRGFAVVADEVRALAERTTSATREIEVMIKTMQSGTSDAVSAMQQGVQQVEAGTVEAARSGAALKDILAKIMTVSDQIAQIAAAAEQQTATTCEIAGGVQQITDVIQGTAASAQQSADAATTLNACTEQLETLVRQFKI